ncbi:sigma-54 dependent transcriptional regulator [uncultured Desulfosarcina sp.]|uniref:sigma-54-dependent transcriptional regulator n=1 Tax=uncultured Desulfosarcina sp. TaxID=218289 RepID=UPI0029C844F1|nr:sigma-54 dependent transcriptional regulator [uncultured Desulfosarcina sp.]
MTTRILIVDDELKMLAMLQRTIAGELPNVEIETASSGEEALEQVAHHSFDVALVDIRMPTMDGLCLLERLKERDRMLTVIMMTAFGAVDVAVAAIKKGAYDFITKPFDRDALVLLIQKAAERGRLLRENLDLRERIADTERFENFIGTSARMQKIYETIQMISRTDVTVLITGESGTGKNLAAMAIHAMSPRCRKPFVRVNCPAIPEQILESELFGYRKGAFTHASQDKKGMFQAADGGTIYLDEIGDISLPVQTKLLLAIEDKEIKPLGDPKNLVVDVRVIASTNCDLKVKVGARQFREDLYYRLNVVNLKMPPLRERREDLPLLIDHFLSESCRLYQRPKKQFAPQLMQRFLSHPWEGNVRELENVIKRAVVMAPGDTVYAEDIGWTPSGPTLPAARGLAPYKEAKKQVLAAFDRDYASQALQASGGNVTQAAQMAGIERQSLQQIMKRCGIKSDEFRNGPS